MGHLSPYVKYHEPGSAGHGAMSVAGLMAAIAALRRRGARGRLSAAEQRELDRLCVRLAALQPWRSA
jgi:hypothetical protein